MGKQNLNSVLDDLEDDGLIEDEDALYQAFSDWAEQSGRSLYPHQEDALIELITGNHVIAETPTGSGKSMIALAGHFLSLARGGRSYYTAPLKALVSEKFFDLVDTFGAANVGMITGDVALNADAPIICCTAEILANQSLREGSQLDSDMVIMDEFHFYGDPQRGWAWQVPLLELDKPQFVFLSATLGNTEAIASSLESRTERPVALISDAVRPVPLQFDYVVDELGVVVERLVNEGEAPVYVVHFTQNDAVKTAVTLAKTLDVPRETRQDIQAALRGQEMSRGFGKTLRELLLKGVAVHHAGMLPRYRRLVERLAQRGLLLVICGTDTLGVGINVPIRTVLFTSLVKYDGRRSRHLSAREFHQIAGRAGRPGFDSVGYVKALGAPDEVEALARKARMTAAQEAGDRKKQKKIAKKGLTTRKQGELSWTRSTFDRLTAARPEALQPRFQSGHAVFLNVLEGPGDPEARILRLAREAEHGRARGTGREEGAGMQAHRHLAAGDSSVSTFAAPPGRDPRTERTGTQGAGGLAHEGESNRFLREFGDIYRSLLQAGLIERVPAAQRAEGGSAVRVVGNLPDDFALNQPLAPFALAALELLDPDSPAFAMDVVSVIEAVMEDPRQLLYAQQRSARDRAFHAMREEGLDYEQRRDALAEIGWPKPLEEVLIPSFRVFAQSNPWVKGSEPSPKSVVREMVEDGLTFSLLISRYDIANSEGVVLRYLTDIYKALRQVLPARYQTEEVERVIEWLRQLLGSVDSSLVSEWETMMTEGALPQSGGASVPKKGRALGAGGSGAPPLSLPADTRGAAGGSEELAFGAGPDGQVRWSTNRHALRTAIRNAMFQRVEMASRDQFRQLAAWEPPESPWSAERWDDALGAYWDEFDSIAIDQAARSAELFAANEAPEVGELLDACDAETIEEVPITRAGDRNWWIAQQVLLDPDDSGAYRMVVLIDIQQTLADQEVAARTVRFGSLD